MTYLKTLFLIPLLFLSVLLPAQTTTINDIIDIENVSRGNILENNEIKGYYVFSRIDKVAPKTYSYLLRIFDANMNEAVSTTLEKSRHAHLVESTFNGQAFMFLFFDGKKKNLELITYDKKGKELGSKIYEKLSTSEIRMYNSLGMLSEETSNPSIFPVGNRGFLRTHMIVSGMKYRYRLDYFPNDMSESETWTVGTPKNSKMLEFPSIQSIGDKFATVVVVRRKGVMSKNWLYALQLLDLESGEVVFEEDMLGSDYNRSAVFSQYDPESKEVIVAGNYFRPKDKTTNGKPLGLYFNSYNADGSANKKKLLSWEKDMSKFLDVNAKGRMEEGGFITLHKIVKTPDGKIFAIGERFRRSASAGGIALNVLAAASGSSGPAAANVKMILEEMYVFEMDQDFNLKDIKVFEKRKSDVYLIPGYGNLGPSMLAYIMKALGEFDYEYTQEDKEKGIFYSTYFTTIKEKGERREPIFGVIAYDGEELTTDQISLKTDAKYIWVDPAKPGYVAIWEYYKKEKKLTLRFEQINF